MKNTLILDYHPTDLNTYINQERTHRQIAAKTKKAETGAVEWECKRQKLTPLTNPVRIDFFWYVKNKKKDPDNIAFAKKFILDGLVDAGIITNDGFKNVKGFSDYFVLGEKDKVIIDIIET